MFVVSSGLLCACNIWGAMATSFESLLWSSIVAAVAGSSTEALGAAMVNVSTCLEPVGLDVPGAGICLVLLLENWSPECKSRLCMHSSATDR